MEFRGVNRSLDDETNQVAGASKSERIGAFLKDHERATVFLQRYGSAAAPSEKRLLARRSRDGLKVRLVTCGVNIFTWTG